MNTFNNFSPLAFREKSMKATYKKWYAYGKEFALPFSTTELPPFQFTVANLPSFDPTTVEVFLVNEATGVRGATGIKIKVDAMDGHGSVLYVSPGSNVYAKSIEPGVYRAEFAIPGGETYVSTPICVTEGIETNTNFVKLEYWNDEKLAYPNGFVTTGTDNDFKFQMYIPTTFFKPKYEFEEEITKRAGYKFLELQTCNKVFGFNFLAPEYICDALRLVRLSDYIRFTHDGEYYNALNFEYNPDWQDNGYLAAIECQFETDTIIQKLPSFNRRDRESFYNALLANIDTPIMFSPDTVGLYYKEYRETEPVVKGKLIRELSPIDLIDENTTIAVDLGTGEARKFNLYRMLQDYISKAHEDATDFLLHLRGGATFGEGITGSSASINAVGDAEVQGLNARVTKVKSLDSEDYVTVNKTAFTVNKQGDTALNALNARGVSRLQQDVYTGNDTGKITKEGQLQYLSAIIQQFLSSPTFVSGFLGEGFKIWVENGNWHIECDNLTVRQTMNIFELLIQKIRSVNGALVVSQSNGKIKSVSEDETNYVITMEEEGETFQPNDLVRCQVWTGSKTKFYWVEVSSVSGNSITVKKSEFTAGNKPEKGDEVVQMGNTQNAQRQALIYITAQESGHPYIEILNGVKTKSLSGTNRTRLGDLSNIQDSAFPEGQQPSGSGLYCDNAFLRGIFLLRNGKSVEDEVNQAKQDAANAATEAERAQQTAQEAKDRLNKWADDGFISPTEKPALIDEGKRIQAEFLQIKNNADKYGVSVTEYTKAYEDYLNELRYHSAQQPEDIAVRPELAKTQTIYYDRRNGALNAIANAAKSYVDEADKKLKEYLDTEITAIPGKIELAVSSLKLSDTNYLNEGYKQMSNSGGNNYLMAIYPWAQHLIVGKTYTLTVCYKCGAKTERIYGYNNPSFGPVPGGSDMTSKTEEVKSTKIIPSNEDAPAGFHFYKSPPNDDDSYIKWAVITDGNLGVTSWIPSASEKNVGLKNLCSFKRITDAGFTYASRYDDDGTILMLPGVLHSESLVANKDMFGLTYDTQKRYYVFIDHAVKSSTIPSGQRSIFLRVMYTDGSSSDISVFNDRIENRYLLSDKPISRILGSYGISISTYLRIGIYETNFPVSWSPAPEDQLYQSVKYTDTQILAVDGKIELSVTTELNKRVIGGANLCLKSGVCITGVENHLRINMSKYWRDLRGKKVTLSFDYEYSNLVLGRNSRIGLEEGVLKDGTSNYYYIGAWKYFDSTSLKAGTGRFVHTITVPNDIVNAQNIGIGFYIQVGDGTTMKICNPQIEIGDTATGWKPAPEDGVNQSIEYTTSQIGIVEGKITSTVEKINAVDGKVTGLASRVTQTENSITSVVGDINVLNSTTNRHVTKQIDLVGWDNNKFFPLVISLPVGHKSKIEINRPLNVAYGKPSYGTHKRGFSMNLTFEMSGSGWGSLPWVLNVFDYTKAWIKTNDTKIVVDLGEIIETSTCVMGIRGGSKYDITVYDQTDPNAINVYQTDYHGPYNTSFPVRTDGTEPVRTYGYYTEIKQTQESITATAAKVDDQGRRLSAAELTLSADHAKLSVVETTANNANSLAGTANNKAEAADGRVTATQNGLVETGINIQSRKIVLKSDNVLFQNNAGQQTAAINANGKLTANAIEVGEVVAGGFAAQRITTGNLTVTDGAVIAGMTISGGRLTGANMTLTEGAKIGKFEITNLGFLFGKSDARIDLWGGSDTTGGRSSRLGAGTIAIENNSSSMDSLTITGAGNVNVAGTTEIHNVNRFKLKTKNYHGPGVWCYGKCLNGTLTELYRCNDNIQVTCVRTSKGYYRFTLGGEITGIFCPIAIPRTDSTEGFKWINAAISNQNSRDFTVFLYDVNEGAKDGNFYFAVLANPTV